MKSNENLEICSECGGGCCKSLPGVNHPEDFGFHEKSEDEIYDTLVEIFASGKYQIDWWEGFGRKDIDFDPDVECDFGCNGYYVRPATQKTAGIKVYHPSWGFEGCVFHSKNGCTLSFRDRPAECRALIPRKDHKCVAKNKAYSGGKLQAAQKWEPYWHLLTRAADQVESKKE